MNGMDWSKGIRLALLGTLVMLFAAIVIASCITQADDATPVEEELIMYAATSFFVRSGGIPDYEATVEHVEADWARVRISPAAVEPQDGAPIMYLRKQLSVDDAAPTATVAAAEPGFAPQDVADGGWVVVTGPDANFTQAELDAAGVPPFIRGQ